MWAPTNYAIIKGLEVTGFEAFAAAASERYLAAMAEVFQNTGTVWENYAPEHPAPGNPAARDFVGWSACGPIALLLENVLGFRPDGENQALHWNLRLTESHGIRRLRFGKVTADLFYDGAGNVTVRSELPFTLTINDRHFDLQPGETRLQGVVPQP